MNPDDEAVFGPAVRIRATCFMAGLYLQVLDIGRADRCMQSMLAICGVTRAHPVLLSQQPVRSDGKYLFTIT